MKGYKAFNKGLICRGKQYAENTVFEEKEAEIYRKGMHFCENPVDTLMHYQPVDKHGDLTEFAEVEALSDVHTSDDINRNLVYCTKKLKIGKKLKIEKFVTESINYLFEKIGRKDIKPNERCFEVSKYKEGLAVDEDSLHLYSSSDYCELVSKGMHSCLTANGDYSKLASSGYHSRLSTNGRFSKLIAKDDSQHLSANGENSTLISTGGWARLSANDACAMMVSTREYSRVSSNGGFSRLFAKGKCSRLVSTGNYTTISAMDKNSVAAAIGDNSKIKGVKGAWITLAEYKRIDNEYVCVCVKSAQIDGKILKPDVFYELVNGEFVEAD